MNFRIRYCLCAVLLVAAAFGNGWVGQQLVNRPNGDTFDAQPTSAVDHSGHPWVAWVGHYGDTTLLWSRWLDTHWEPQRGVSANAPGVWQRFRPDLAFNEQGRAWLVWHNAHEDNTRDIAACFWDGSRWTPEQQVNQPDSTDVDFAPKVACGGGQVWCVWYGGPTDVSPYSVFASRWDPERGSWEPETQVSPPDGNEHWWCDVTVDANGTPHVVWCELAATDNYPFFINYSYYDGHQWAGPIRVNDTAGVCAAPWAAPRIVTDREGTMHVCYTGVAVGATGRDIFYSRNDGSGWTPSVRVTQDTADNYSEWYSDIAADRPDNVWVTWDRQGEGSDQFRVYAAHFDGLLWSSEQRLDDDSASRRENCPSVCLDSTGCPWVFWNDESNGGDVYFNRYLGSGVAEPAAATLNSSPCVIASPNPSTGTVTIECGVPLAPGAGICIFSQDGRQVRRLAPGLTQPGGSPTTSTWDGTDELGRSVPGGVYLAVVEGQAGVRAKLVKLD